MIYMLIYKICWNIQKILSTLQYVDIFIIKFRKKGKVSKDPLVNKLKMSHVHIFWCLKKSFEFLSTKL